MKILLVDESYPLNTRNSKILESLSQFYPGCSVHVVTWDRAGDFASGRAGEGAWHWHLYTRLAAYGNKLQKLTGMFGFRSFCSRVVRELSPDVVIASHWNNLLMLPALDYRRQMLIYENLDAPTGPASVRLVLRCIERFYMKRAALTIHASRFYTSIYPSCFRQIVLENKPVIDAGAVPYSPAIPLRIAYLGNIRYLEILKNLADAVRGDSRFCLYYHGGGPDFSTLQEYVAGEANIHITGPYQYKEIETLYSQADVIWAAYPNKDFNVRYAISNKFHESIAYAIPAIYADNTCLGEYVADKGLGFRVNPYCVEDIRALLVEMADNRENLMATHETLKRHSAEETSWSEDFLKVKEAIDAFAVF